MERIYTVQEAVQKMQKSVDFYRVRLEAWEKVKRVYKKGGGDFANLARNFEGAKFEPWLGDQVIKVYFRDECGRYESDYINLKGNAYKNEPDADTADAVADKIAEQIANYKRWLEIDAKGAEQIAGQIEEMAEALETLKNIIEKGRKTNTHYTLRDYIKGNLDIF